MPKVINALVSTLLVSLPIGTCVVKASMAQDLRSFGVVSGQSLTNTGPTTIVGNIAVSPGTSYTGSNEVTQTGEIFLGDAVALRIQNDLTTLYTVLEGRPTSQGGDLTGQDLGGMTLQPGVYNFDTSAGIAAGQTLILDGGGDPDAIFIFNIGSTLTAGSGATVVLQNGAQGGNVFYRVGSSATLDTTSDLQGQIIALTSITMNTEASIGCGAAQARNGSVTLDTNTIEICTLDATGFEVIVPPVVVPPTAGEGTGSTPTPTPVVPETETALATTLSDYVASGGTLPIGLAILPATLTAAELAASLSQLTGEVSTAVAPVGIQAMSGFLDTVVRSGRTLRLPVQAPRDAGVPVGMVPEKINNAYSGKYGSEPMAEQQPLTYGVTYAQPADKWEVWASGYGSSTRVAADVDLGFQERTYQDTGFAVGVNYAVSDRTNLGVAASWNVAGFDLDDGLGSGSSDSVFVALRARSAAEHAYIEGALGFGRGNITTTRTVTIAGLDRFVADTTADSIGAYVEAGYRLGKITPFAALRAQSFKTPAYSETTVAGSNSYALSYGAATATSVRSELGVDLGWTNNLAKGGSSSFGLRAAWAHEFASNDATPTAFQNLPDVTFPVSATDPSRNSVVASARIGLASANGFTLDGSVNAEYSDSSQEYGGALTVGFTW